MHAMLKKILQSGLPEVGQQDCAALASLLCCQPVERSTADFSDLLVATGAMPDTLLHLLMSCENALIQQLAATAEPKSLVLLAQCLDQIKALQQSILAAFARQMLVPFKLSEFGAYSSGWAQQGFVQLHNYYHEMPVSARAGYLTGAAMHIEVALSAEVARVFAAAGEQRQAYAMCPDGSRIVRFGGGKVVASSLRLEVLAIEPARRERRKVVRVQPETAPELRLMRHGEMVVATMHDISVDGVGLELASQVGLQPGETVGCLWRLDANKIYIEAIVRWVHEADGRCQAGLAFTSLGPFSELIQKLVMSEQQKIVVRLRALPIPFWMNVA
ncbi:PilZ domain-containing protein [Mariprofundus erugo]|uniref:PilZ domain-containing protein n=1 Tax=Mariprofundus erugo TaxID=2528639 RepID=A0A5R9GW86_9PROT|nr:PilZ domain-containing protein [Mariprofundus erugo]TLS69135.1 PilZ domain-containing protein [Mariprofundus erugo]